MVSGWSRRGQTGVKRSASLCPGHAWSGRSTAGGNRGERRGYRENGHTESHLALDEPAHQRKHRRSGRTVWCSQRKLLNPNSNNSPSRTSFVTTSRRMPS